MSIEIDLGVHAGDKCIAVIQDAMARTEDKVEKAHIALMALGMLSGATGAAFANAYGGNPSLKAASGADFTCAVLDIAKEIVLNGPDEALKRMRQARRP